MIPFADFANTLIPTSNLTVIVKFDAIPEDKHCKLLEYIKSNKEIELDNQCILQVQNSKDSCFIEQFLIDNGYTTDSLLKMYKNLFYGIR